MWSMKKTSKPMWICTWQSICGWVKKWVECTNLKWGSKFRICTKNHSPSFKNLMLPSPL
jgi:hypothetical protein